MAAALPCRNRRANWKKDAPSALALPRLQGEVVFEDVHFRYGSACSGEPAVGSENDRDVLHDVDLTMAPGEVVALVGPSGAGKTSIANLLCRFYDPISGRVLVDGQDVRQVTLESLRRQTAVVLQDTFLFNTTVRDNLLIGEQMSEKVKIQAGSAYPLEPELTVEIRGRNLVTGLPEAIDVSSVELREALRGSVGIIVETIRQAVDETPPELVADLMEHGIALAGGGALLKGLAQRLTEETKMRVYVADDPLSCVARGAGMVLEDFDILQKTLASMQRGSTLH